MTEIDIDETPDVPRTWLDDPGPVRRATRPWRAPTPTQIALRCGLCLGVTGWHATTTDALAEHNAHTCRDYTEPTP